MGCEARQVLTNDHVRLADDFPVIGLHLGDRGIVRSAWHYPNVAYEVEFQIGRQAMRILLMEDQVTAEPVQ